MFHMLSDTYSWHVDEKRLMAISLKEHNQGVWLQETQDCNLSLQGRISQTTLLYQGRMIFVVHPRIFSRAPKFYSPNASNTSSPAMTTRNVSKYFQISPEVQNCPTENHWSREKMIAYWTKWIICTFSHLIYKIFISLWSMTGLQPPLMFTFYVRFILLTTKYVVMPLWHKFYLHIITLQMINSSLSLFFFLNWQMCFGSNFYFQSD